MLIWGGEGGRPEHGDEDGDEDGDGDGNYMKCREGKGNVRKVDMTVS